MNILICSERFLFRFGADRVLLILAKGLKDLGHTVSIMGNNFDHEIVQTFASQIIEVPTDKDYLNLNEYTYKWLESTWDHNFNKNTEPDIVLVGGWPFFSSIPFFKKMVKNVIFIDFGAVPLDGYSGSAFIIQKKLRNLRKRYLKEVSLITGISEFIVNSQSKVDSEGEVPVRSVLLGADHMEMSIWEAKHLRLEKSTGYVINLLESLKNQGRKTVLCLGRWEPDCYKNSHAAFDIMPQINDIIPDCALLILSDPSDTKIPSRLENTIYPIGFPDDEELIHVMEAVDLGISFSLWEGFNLPLAEMQWLDRPALAFNIGAHPEVVLHPWYLCHNDAEMITKACEILSGQGLDKKTRAQSLEKFRDYFKWDRFIKENLEIFEKISRDNKIVKEENGSKKNEAFSLIIDVTNSSKDPANSGVVRVTRRLCRELQHFIDPIFVVWDTKTNCYVLPTKAEFQQLGRFNGPLQSDVNRFSQNKSRVTLNDYLANINNNSIWLLFSETVDEKNAHLARNLARQNGIKLAAIFYDAIPVLNPNLCRDVAIRDNHSRYMKGLADCDVVIPISNFSSRCLEKFWKDNNIEGGPLAPNLLPGEFGGSGRNVKIHEKTSNEIKILCVSTLEPRKNHKNLVEACLLMQEKHPELKWSLTLVGNRYAGASEIADFIQDISKRNPCIKWLGIVDDATLHKLYEESTFTVYPSIIEGFGMPIIESLWHGRPCICYNKGVMAELADDGGCFTTDVTNIQKLSDAIYKLAIDKNLFDKLSNDAVSRKIKTWNEYTREFISILESQNKKSTGQTFQNKNLISGNNELDNRTWQEILYPDCLCDTWQMHDFERLALTALLSRHKPQCSIEISTNHGGSLSLISQFSKIVFSIDIDPEIPLELKQLKNVSFFSGSSSIILPLLLKELEESGIPVDFILIDGDHSAEGIKKDINAILSYIPKKPLFVLMYGSFNPESRRGMMEANWESSPYVDYVDLDFIPGKIEEHDGSFNDEYQSGLGIAYFKPLKRNKPIKINRSSWLK